MMKPPQIVVARALLGWTRARLCEELKGTVKSRTLDNLETGVGDPKTKTLEAVERALTAAGITFDPDGVNVHRTVKPKRKS